MRDRGRVCDLVKELEVANAETVAKPAGKEVESAAYIGHVVDVQKWGVVVAAAKAAGIFVVEICAANKASRAVHEIEIETPKQM